MKAEGEEEIAKLKGEEVVVKEEEAVVKEKNRRQRRRGGSNVSRMEPCWPLT